MATNTVPMAAVAHLQSVVHSVLRDRDLGTTTSRLDATSEIVRLVADAGWAPPARDPAWSATPTVRSTAANLIENALADLGDALAHARAAQDDEGLYVEPVAYAMQRAQVHATLAVAAAIREAGGWVIDKLPFARET